MTENKSKTINVGRQEEKLTENKLRTIGKQQQQQQHPIENKKQNYW